MTALTTNNTRKRRTPSLTNTFADPHTFLNRALEEFTRPLGRSADSGSFDLIRHEDSYEFQVNVPGFGRDEITVELEDNTIKVSAERDEEQTEGDQVIGRRRSSFSYSWPMSDDMKAEDISASLDNGVLSIDVPRKEQYVEEDETKQIEIE